MGADQLNRVEDDFLVTGENSGLDFRLPVAEHANRRASDERHTTYINLGEHGLKPLHKLRFGQSEVPGHITLYEVESESDTEHNTGKLRGRKTKIAASVVALGVVTAGLLELKYRKK